MTTLSGEEPVWSGDLDLVDEGFDDGFAFGWGAVGDHVGDVLGETVDVVGGRGVRDLFSADSQPGSHLRQLLVTITVLAG